MKSTKKALLLSMMSMLLCVAMLMGTTFAWFTDSVTSGVNTITAGNLDIELEYSKNGTTWQTVEGDTKLFDDVALWEPGATSVVYLKLTNKGTLALKYNLAINVANEVAGTNVAGDSFKLSDYIKMGVDETWDGTAYADRAAARAAVSEAGNIETYAMTGNMLANADPTILAVVVYMPEDVGNAANYQTLTTPPSIELGVSVIASQFVSESDSFGNDYDNMEVATDKPSIASIFEAMSKTIEAGVTTDPTKLPEEIVVLEPITLAPTPVQVGETEENLAPEIDGASTTIVLNDTMSVGSTYTPGDTWGGLRVQGQSGRTSDVTFKGNETGKFTSVGSNVASLIYIEGNSHVVFESGTFETDCRIICYGQMGTGTSTVEIKGGTFKFAGASKDNQAVFSKSGTNGLGFVAIGNDGLTITITGGTFYNCDPSLSGKVAAGYKVDSQEVENDIIYTVVPDSAN